MQNRVHQDYLPESYARHLPSYLKCNKIVAPTRCGPLPFPTNLYGKHWGRGKILPNSQYLLICPIRKIPLNRFKSFPIKKFHFLLIMHQFSSNHHMPSSFVAAVISVVSYFKFQAFCTHMSC